MEWIQRLRVRQLYVLLALHETCNLSQTAARLHITQPALSKWLRELETDLAVELFERHSKGLIPTRFCDTLVLHARVVLGELERTDETLRAMSDGSVGQIIVGSTPIGVSGLLPESISSFRKLHGGVCVTVHENSLEKLLPLLNEGRLDFVIARIEEKLDPSLACEVLYSESICLVASSRHPLARKKKVSWEQTRDFPWIVPPAQTPLRHELDLALAAAGEGRPRACVEASSTMLIVSLLQGNELLALMSGEVQRYFSQLGQLKVLPLHLARQATVGVLWRPGAPRTRAKDDFLACLKAATPS